MTKRMSLIGFQLTALLTALFIFLTVVNPASAQVESFGKYLDDLPTESRPANYRSILDATKHYKVENDRAHCTLQFVSNHGHALTARHCFLAEIRTQDDFMIKANIEGTSVYKFDSNKMKAHKFGISITTFPEVPKEQGVSPVAVRSYQYENSKEDFIQAKVVAVGEISYNDPTISHNSFKTLKKIDGGYFSDFILLKFPVQSNFCVETDTPNHGESIFTVSFPNRHIKNIADRRSVTRGQITGKIEKGSDTSSSLLEGINQLAKEAEGKILFHSALTGPGASGGGVYNNSGKLIGINLAGILNRSTEKEYLPGSYNALSIIQIKSLLKKSLSDSEISEAFDCRSR